MTEIKWIKISTGIFDDEKIQLIEAMPDADTMLVIWLKLLVQAGKVNHAGEIHMEAGIPYTDEMLSTIFRRPLNSIRLALATFQQFKMIEIIDGVIEIRNWSKHQNIDGMEKVKEQWKLASQKYRNKDKQLELPAGRHMTSYDSHKIELEQDIDKDIDKELESSSSSLETEKTVFDCFIVYEKEIGLLTPLIKDEIEKYCKNFPADWIIDAMVLASKNNHRSWSYAAGILKNWSVKGRDVAPGGNGHKQVDFKATGDRERHTGTYETDGIVRTAEDMQKHLAERNTRMNFKNDGEN